jgi:hypothetical protein
MEVMYRAGWDGTGSTDMAVSRRGVGGRGVSRESCCLLAVEGGRGR